MDSLRLFLVVAFGLFGLVFGSFANVVIWRQPRGESVVSPPSHCPACDHEIRWYDNIPIISWLALRGKCRDCGVPIPVRYIAVEAISGVLFVMAAVFMPTIYQSLAACVLFWFLLVLSAIDIDTWRLPNQLVAMLAVTGLALAVISQLLSIVMVPLRPVVTSGILTNPLASSLAGALLGAGIPGVVAAVYGAVRGKTGLGMGDVKLLGAMGIFMGPYVLVALVIGSLFGAIVGIARARGREMGQVKIPFGPSLALGAVMTALAGPLLVAWYLVLVGVS